ncbi:MAG: recombinase family protein [Actinomyces sp.]|jgi:DNA invertase Pin-like site-specific DNA recombinase|nr:recombinase family protein [Actinomyces sp.]MCI1788024.1 recombinase family protein [Actinomyces sp.]MCI1830573.1 recombinase family protein [Actinomyces sp.]
MKAVAYTYDADPWYPLVQAQKAKCARMARSAGYEVVAQVHDQSGNREGLQRLLDTAHGRGYDAIVVTELERLADDEKSLDAILDRFDAEGVAVITFPPEVGRALKELIAQEIETLAEQSNRDENVDPELDDEQVAQWQRKWERKVDAVIAQTLATYYPDIEWTPSEDD